jgi:hypothetical protein
VGLGERADGEHLGGPEPGEPDCEHDDLLDGREPGLR